MAFINSEGEELVGVVKVVEESDAKSNEDVDDDEEDGEREDVGWICTGRDTADVAGCSTFSVEDSGLSLRSSSRPVGFCGVWEDREVVENDAETRAKKLCLDG